MNRKHAPTINNINKTKKRQPPAYKKKHKRRVNIRLLTILKCWKQAAKRPSGGDRKKRGAIWWSEDSLDFYKWLCDFTLAI